MILININDLTHHYVIQQVLNGVDWTIQQGEKIGLVGANGAGKSTLLRLIAGELKPESGTIFVHKAAKIGYLAQEPRLDPSRTIWEETLSASAEITATQAQLRELERRMADPAVVADEAAFNRVMAAYDRAQRAFDEMGGYAYESKVRAVLHSLGLSGDDLDLPIAHCSGGQRKMVGIAKLLAAGVNVLLLDEPDNHLDLARKAYLEQFIRAFDGTIVIISHDRYLLDRTVTRVTEVEDQRLYHYDGNYTQYTMAKEARLLRQQQMYQAQQKEIARIEEAIARFEYWAKANEDARAARQARSRHKMLERMEKVEQPILERRRMELDLQGWRGSNKVLEINDLDMVFTDRGEEEIVLAGLELLIWRGERVGLLGPNGAGKSVLFRCILDQLAPSGGEIKLGPSVQIGYYSQQHETLDLDKTLIEEVRQVKPMYENQACSFLGSFLFPYELCRKQVRQLSGGERNRLQLAKLMLSPVNFLLLDEPTNNLDLPSCEVLENALDRFEGTVLVISHDRYFLDRVVDRIVELDDGGLTEYVGDYTYYQEEKARRMGTAG